jgi:hypothetical protein
MRNCRKIVPARPNFGERESGPMTLASPETMNPPPSITYAPGAMVSCALPETRDRLIFWLGSFRAAERDRTTGSS